MNEKLLINYTENPNHGKKMDRLLSLCMKINKSVDSICKNASEEKYKAFNGNHCIQTAACTKYILDEVFGTHKCKTSIVYGIMTDDECKGTIYNHAYIYMEYGDYSYIIDTSRNTRKALLCCSKSSTCIYGENSVLSIPEYDDIRVLEIGVLDYEEILKEQKEFFTGSPSTELFNKVKFLCQAKIDSFKKW